MISVGTWCDLFDNNPRPVLWSDGQAQALYCSACRFWSSSFVTDVCERCGKRLRPGYLNDLREAVWEMIRRTSGAIWMIQTRHGPSPAAGMGIPPGLSDRLWLAVGVSTQADVDRLLVEGSQLWERRIGKLVLVAEPLLEPLDLRGLWKYVGWLIVGGEYRHATWSSHLCRLTNLANMYRLIEEARTYQVPVWVTQLGSWVIDPGLPNRRLTLDDPQGRTWDEWPSDLRIRERPRMTR